MRKLSSVLILLIIGVIVVGCSSKQDIPSTDVPKEIELKLDASYQTLDYLHETTYKGAALPSHLDDVSVTYATDELEVNGFIENDMIALHNPEYGPGIVEIDITLRYQRYEKTYTKRVWVMPQFSVDDLEAKTVHFNNVSSHYDVAPTSLTLYQIKEGIPYVDLDEFLELVSPVAHTNGLTKTLEENRLAYTFYYMGRTYVIDYDFASTTLAFNHSDFFNAIGVFKPAFSMIESCGALCSVSYYSSDKTESVQASFDIGQYGMQFIRDADDVYVPLALANEFFSGPFYDVAYTGSNLVGYDLLDLYGNTFLDIVYPDTPLSAMNDVFKSQTYHYLALVLDIFYGLDAFFNIDDFYQFLEPFVSSLLGDTVETHYDGIVEAMLGFDERHSGTRYHGFYLDDQVVDRDKYHLGPRVSELRASELWLKEMYCDYEDLVEISLDGTLARVRFNQFREAEFLAFLEALDTLEAVETIEDVIVDLSCNTGGLLSILLSASGLFTDDTFTYSYMNTLHLDEMTQEIMSPLDKLPYTLYIQTSQLSYSASHIFTSYIDYYNLATIIGQPTGGGAAAIREMVLPNGSHIVVSSQLAFLNPDGTIIELSHEPEILVPYEDFIDLDSLKLYLD